jgi:serine protease AprX
LSTGGAGGCALCGRETPAPALAEAGWISFDAEALLAAEHPGWRRSDGACPACVQQALLVLLLEKGDAALHAGVQGAWPLDAEAAFGALPTPLRLHADPRFTGRGVTVAMVDAAFHPHPDLVLPRNRIRAWADASREGVVERRFAADERPTWPGADALDAGQWHGLMTSAAAAGNGHLGHGFYRGLASEADLVLVQVRDAQGRITNASIARALRWLGAEGPALGVKVVNLSLGGEPTHPLRGNAVDEAVDALVEAGVTVVAAAGNDGVRALVPPGTAPAALTIGGLDDRNTLDHAARALWHGNYGSTADGAAKPELVAPSLWVVAPVLPGTALAREARELFARRARGDRGAEARIGELKLVTPHYQHVEGTSFAAPLTASVVACLLEASPGLSPAEVRHALVASAEPVPGVGRERQGAGALHAGHAVKAVLEPAGVAAAGP